MKNIIPKIRILEDDIFYVEFPKLDIFFNRETIVAIRSQNFLLDSNCWGGAILDCNCTEILQKKLNEYNVRAVYKEEDFNELLYCILDVHKLG